MTTNSRHKHVSQCQQAACKQFVSGGCCLFQVAGFSDKTWLRGKETRVTPDQIEQSVNDSLQRLQTDHLDLLQIHWPDRYLPLFGSGTYDPQKQREDDVSFEEQLRGLENVIKAGKVDI